MAPPNLTKPGDDLLTCGPQTAGPFSLKARNLTVHDHPFLLDVPANILLTPTPAPAGAFVGFTSDHPKSRHVIPLGRLVGTRFMSIFRFKVWWTTLWVGSSGRDLEHETQLLLLDKSPDGGRPYVLLLPIVDGSFRASLQPGAADDYVDLCAESGSTKVKTNSITQSLYVHVGYDPYSLVSEAVRVVAAHLNTFKILEEKIPPPIVDKFGWCTWDAFYLKVDPEGVWEGVKGLADGGCPPGMVLIDDGWQSICHDDDDPGEGTEGMNRTSAGEQMPCRLIKFEENYKFREYRSEQNGKGMGAFVRDLKSSFETVESVYVWHALCGYWGGLRPGVEGLPESRVVRPKLSPGLEKTMEDLAVDKIVNNGVGLVAPERAEELYEGLHSHLKSVGIDGVKVDVIHLLEMLSENYGGRVELAKSYYKALTKSINKHFNGNGVIASMEHCNDFMLLGTEAISLGRVGDDFWCTDPSGDPNGTFWLQGCHMVHCAYNSLWMANFIHPDWDMFQSTHPCAAFHAASRAVSGGPIYVSDSVGRHDFELLRSIALPDGTILRCRHYALPTRDCLFEDPLHDGRTMLKIWNLNKFTGVIGAFNCQGGGWCRKTRKNKSFSEYSHTITAKTSPSDVEWGKGRSPISINRVELFAVYSSKTEKVQLLKLDEKLEVTLDPFDYELLTVSPILKVTSPNEKPILFAPIGLTNMLNCGGAIDSFDVDKETSKVSIGVKGRGKMKCYSSVKPKSCRMNGELLEEFSYENDDMMVSIEVPWSGSSSKLNTLEYYF